MTQPTAVNMTFDTSLVDTQAQTGSFSTTESDPSDAGWAMKTPTLQQGEDSQTTPKQSQEKGESLLPPGQTLMSPPPKPSTPVQHIPTQDAYDEWASVYDMDGNMLQSIDDVELATLLPELISLVLQNSSNRVGLLDLGCGTGRNTSKLLNYAWPQDLQVDVMALDFSKGMLDVAATKLQPLVDQQQNLRLKLEQCNCFPTDSDLNASPLPLANLAQFDALTSTLVLEHISLPAYFTTLSALVTKGGHALVTNMHSEMGKISQAGFINKDGVKVRGTSYAHTPEETVEEAKKAGFAVLSLKERAVEKEDVETRRVGERGNKWIGIKVWYGLLLRKIA
ncbi:S-adenosyl-L-methionine-dependent methyltransferase [Lophiotrema nucula]|uniref:S-adenosyl-L-methionine-dependent methyltransferase n=1 Tax=Lophiotrema nucula TaxID=690887 RepID=A0A6A5Z0L1_9PLEO|nr:S-adenosyl-L-methionine-dependent methyltransferase [Lophiotrema nucula]